MTRKKIKRHHEPGEHIWEGLTEYQLKNPDEFINWLEGGIEDKIEVLNNLRPNQYIIYSTFSQEELKQVYKKEFSINDTRKFNSEIENLKKQGLDIGKGDSEYGYKMPLPKKGNQTRELIIFRRK